MGSFGRVRKRGGNKAALVKEKMVVEMVFVCVQNKEKVRRIFGDPKQIARSGERDSEKCLFLDEGREAREEIIQK